VEHVHIFKTVLKPKVIKFTLSNLEQERAN